MSVSDLKIKIMKIKLLFLAAAPNEIEKKALPRCNIFLQYFMLFSKKYCQILRISCNISLML